jgi:HSP20 family protein
MATLAQKNHNHHKSHHDQPTGRDTLIPHGFDDFFSHHFLDDPFFADALKGTHLDLLPHESHHHHHRHNDSEGSDSAKENDRIDQEDNSAIRRASPGYEIIELSNKYQIDVDVPGIHRSNLFVDLEHHGRIVHIHGQRTKVIRDDGSVREETTRFSKRFSIGKKVDVKNMKAHLEDGVLTLTAPKKKLEPERVVRLHITEGPSDEDDDDDVDVKTDVQVNAA